MALQQAWSNMAANYRFHATLRGSLLLRWIYLTIYYFIFIFFRWGNRYLRALRWLKALGLSNILVDIETPEGLRLRLDLHTAFDPLYYILAEKSYQELDHFELKPGQVVLDAGANIGVFTTLAAKRVGASGLIIAVEPHPGNFDLLSDNVKRNGLTNVRLVHAALDEHKGDAELFVHDRAINHSLVRRSGKSIKIDKRTVDDIAEEFKLTQLDLLKIDTEGNVPEILRGAVKSVRRYKPRISFERDQPEESQGLEEFFLSVGYRSQALSYNTYAWPEVRPGR